MKVLIINGVNLNILGIREKNIYGIKTLNDIETLIKDRAKKLEIDVSFFQSNHEGFIVDEIQKAYGIYDYIIINPGAFTHYSIAIRDALLGVGIKAIEVHLSNIYKREEFRHKSVLADIVEAQISGMGEYGYIAALDYIKYRQGE